MKVEVDVLGSLSLIVLMISVDVKQNRFQSSRVPRPGLLVSNSSVVSVDVKQHQISEFRSFLKVEVAVLGSPSLIVLMVSVDVKQH